MRMQPVLFTNEADREGALKGYCSECGMMVMLEEEECCKCSCMTVVWDAPECRDLSYTVGRTEFTRGNQRRLDAC